MATQKQVTKSVSKPTAAKKQATKPDTLTGLVAFIVEGIASRVAKGSPYYARANSYHAQMKTMFPRAKTAAARAALTQERAEKIFSMHDARILPSGNLDGQAMYDIYRVAIADKK